MQQDLPPRRIPISRVSNAYNKISLIILLVLSIVTACVEFAVVFLNVPPAGEICGIGTEEELWPVWMLLDFCINAVISLTDVTTVIVTLRRASRLRYPDLIERLKMARTLGCVASFIWMLYGSSLFLTHSIHLECSEYLQNGGGRVNFSPELYLEGRLHGKATDNGKFLEIKIEPVSMTKTYLPTWLTPFDFDSGWCSATVLSSSQTDSVADCQQQCVVTTGCRAVGFRDQRGHPGECKLFTSSEDITGTNIQPGAGTTTCYVRGMCFVGPMDTVDCLQTSPELDAVAQGRTDILSTHVVPRLINALTEGVALPMLSAQNFTIIQEMEKKKLQKFSCNCKNIFVFGWYLVIYRWALEGVVLATTIGMAPVVLGCCRPCMRNYDFSS